MKLEAFALTVYRQPDVAGACLSLQETIGLDVPILLYCAWFGYCYGDMSDAQLTEAIEKSNTYANTVVKPLRRARRWMNDAKEINNSIRTPDNLQSWATLREQIKTIEISAELLWLDAIDTMTQQHELGYQTVFKLTYLIANMQRYCLRLRTTEELEALDVHLMLATIACACETLADDPIDNEQTVNLL